MGRSGKMERLILSLDIGSSSCKAVVLSEIGKELAMGKGYYPLYYSENQREIEQNPEEIWEGVCEAIGQLNRKQFSISQIAAITLTSQISSHFLVDSENRPLTNVMTWMDSRAAEEAEEMGSSFSPGTLLELLGAEMPVGPSWPIPKLRWMNKHIPHLLMKAKYMIQPKEWVLWKFTSVWRTDRSSLRGLVHQSTGKVCEPLLEWAGIGPDLIPTMGNPYEVVGPLNPSTATLLRLPTGIPVILGWNDLNVAVLGIAGMQQSACGFDITGTSEHIGVIYHSKSMLQNPIMTGNNWIPFLQERHLMYGVTSSGGQSLKWFVENIDQSGKSSFDYDAVIKQAETIPAGAEGLLFLPYINGERSPWWNPSARGVFFGMHVTHDRSHLARAVLEGVGYALRAIYSRLNIMPGSMRIAGGSSQIDAWNQIKADILGIPLVKTKTVEAGCLGAAILAAYGLGWYASLEEACAVMIHTGQEFTPRLNNHAVYEDGYHQFIELYQSLVPLFNRNAPSISLYKEVEIK